MKEITKACIVAFMKARNSLLVWYGEKKKKQKEDEHVFFKALVKNLLLTSNSCLWPTFYQMNSWKGNDMLYYYVILLKVD